MNSKRKHERVSPVDYFMLANRETDKFIGRVVNMSSGGIKVIGVVPVNPETKGYFKLLMPETIDGKDYIEFDAKCMWSKFNEFMQLHETGFEFSNISESERKILKTLLEKWCVGKDGLVKMTR